MIVAGGNSIGNTKGGTRRCTLLWLWYLRHLTACKRGLRVPCRLPCHWMEASQHPAAHIRRAVLWFGARRVLLRGRLHGRRCGRM